MTVKPKCFFSSSGILFLSSVNKKASRERILQVCSFFFSSLKNIKNPHKWIAVGFECCKVTAVTDNTYFIDSLCCLLGEVVMNFQTLEKLNEIKEFLPNSRGWGFENRVSVGLCFSPSFRPWCSRWPDSAISACHWWAWQSLCVRLVVLAFPS